MSSGQLAAVTLLGFALFGALLYVLTLRFGPRRGYFNQPAAKFRPPGTRVRTALYVIAVLHLVAGLVGFVAIPDDGVSPSILIVALLAAGFYVACAQALTLVGTFSRRRAEPQR